MMMEPVATAFGTRNRCQSSPVCGSKNRGIEVAVLAMIAASGLAR